MVYRDHQFHTNMKEEIEAVETRIDLSPEIFKFLTKILKNPNIGYSLKMRIRIALDASNNENSLVYDILNESHEFYSKFQSSKSEDAFIELHDLVKTSKVFIRNISEPARSPELVKRLVKLKKQEEQKAYDKMVTNVKTKKLNLGREMGVALRTSSQQTMTIVNFLVSVGAAYAFGYVASQYAFPDNIGVRIIFSLFLAIIVGIADLYFMARTEI